MMRATQVVSFPGKGLVAHGAAPAGARQGNATPEQLEIAALRARCRAAEDAATTAAAAASFARAELMRLRQTCQQRLETTALEVLELKRELQLRDRLAGGCGDAAAQPANRFDEDDIPFDRIEAVLAASPL